MVLNHPANASDYVEFRTTEINVGFEEPYRREYPLRSVRSFQPSFPTFGSLRFPVVKLEGLGPIQMIA